VVAEAEASLRNRRHFEGLTKAKAALNEMTMTAYEQIAKEINDAKSALKEGGADLGDNSAHTIIERAEDLLAEKRFSDALRAIRFATSEVDQLQSMKSSVEREIDRVEKAIREVESLKIDVKEAKVSLEQAKRYRSSKMYGLVQEMAKQALFIARAEATKRYEGELARIEEDAKIEALKGHDLDQVVKDFKGAFQKKMGQHRYTEAAKALELYRGALNSLNVLRDQCTTSLSKLTEDMVRVPSGSPIMAETARILQTAQQSFTTGSFKECLALNEECRASGAAATRWHEVCSKRMEDFESGLLVGEGRRSLDTNTTGLVDSARRALQNGQYEEMDKAILRAARLRLRAMTESGKREAAELVNLIRIYPKVKLKVEDLPSTAKELLDLPMSKVMEARNLSETVGAVRAKLRKGIEDYIAAVRTKAEGSKRYSSMSLSLLPIAERALAEEKLEQALSLAIDAEKAIGASVPDVQEMRALNKRYHELEEISSSLGFIGGQHLELYRQSLRSRDFTTALQRLRAAVNTLEKATSPFLPKLELTSSKLTNRGHSPALMVKFLEGSRKDQVVFTVLWPERATPLPKGTIPKSRMGLGYRALFISRPLETMLEPSE
jgi:hypothetical protein